MKASDTVMNDEQIQELSGRCVLPCTDYDRQVAIVQAEITWNACIKEVVEWIEKNKTPCTDWEAGQYQERENITSIMRILHTAFSIRKGEWQSKLKEWGC